MFCFFIKGIWRNTPSYLLGAMPIYKITKYPSQFQTRGVCEDFMPWHSCTIIEKCVILHIAKIRFLFSQRMKFFYTCLYFVLCVWLGTSCGSSGKDHMDGKPQEDSFSSVFQDSGEPDSIIIAQEEEVKPLPRLDLSTTELQLAHMRTSENRELYDSGILPQLAYDAPDYCRQILESEGKRFIVVDKAKMKLFLYDPYGNVEKKYGIACAKNYGTKHKKGDSRTTEGIFKVKGVFDSTEWLFTDDNGYTSPTKGSYGPRFIRLNIPYIGIHGTGSPGSIGKRVSHGCIRVTNANILELVKYVEEGMPVIISPGPRDMAVNQKEGYKILAVVTEPGGKRATPSWNETHKPAEQPLAADTVTITSDLQNSDIPETSTLTEDENNIQTEKVDAEPSVETSTLTE